MENQQKKIGIVIDTKIWRSSLLLKSPLGTSLLYHISRINGFIILPEVIKDEVIKHTVEAGTEANKAINKNFKTIEILMGSRTDYELPDENQLELVARNRFTELEKFIVRVPFTLYQAKGGVKRINEKTQPNGDQNQQFKDSVIWEAILTLLGPYDIYFITEDNGFFKGRRRSTNILAENLQEDCIKRAGDVFIHNSIESCLEVIQKKSPVWQKRELIKILEQALPFYCKEELFAKTGFEVASLLTDYSLISAFIIPEFGKLALSFELQYSLVDTQNNQDEDIRSNGRVKMIGECFYELETSKISEINIHSERATWLEQTGKVGKLGFVYAGTLALGGGRNQVKYQFKKEIDLED